MNKSASPNNSAKKPIIRYLMMGLYFTFIGFCAMGIWIKWDAINNPAEEYISHVFEEGFEAVAVTVPIPIETKKLSFLQRLSRRISSKAPVVNIIPKPERNMAAGQTWQKYAASTVVVPDNNARVILVIDDLGMLRSISKQFVNMDVPLTLSFLPYSPDINNQVGEAYDQGHDILVHVPMEPKGRADPGPHALISSASSEEQMEIINYNLSQFSNYVGINNHMGSRFTEDAEAVDRLLDVVKDKGLMVLDSKTTPKSLLEDMAYAKNIPVAGNDIFLDNVRTVEAINAQLSELERMALATGTAVAIGHPYPQTVTALKRWIPTLARKGITIVPISQTIKEKYGDTLLAAK